VRKSFIKFNASSIWQQKEHLTKTLEAEAIGKATASLSGAIIT